MLHENPVGGDEAVVGRAGSPAKLASERRPFLVVAFDRCDRRHRPDERADAGHEPRRRREAGLDIDDHERRVGSHGAFLFRASLDQVVAQVSDAFSHPAKFLRVQAGRFHQVGGRYFLAQPPAGIGQADHHLAFIRGGALPADIAHRFELLEQRRERIGFKEQLLAQAADGLVVLLPQRHDRDVLGVGEADLVQDRLVGPSEGQVGRIDGKAEKVAKSPSWLGFFDPWGSSGHS